MRSKFTLYTLTAVIAFSLSNNSFAGPFPPAAGQTGSTAIAYDDSIFIGWATGIQSYNPGSNVNTSFQTPLQALGTSDAIEDVGKSTEEAFNTVSLGRGGDITLSFDPPIINGAGNDFAIFEYAFPFTFLELAWVEVSENGTDFYRFPAISYTASAVNGFGSIDTTNIIGFAGKYQVGFGTPFDLQNVFDAHGITLSQVAFVRIVDIIGDGNDTDSLSQPIYDPYPTIGSAGFDLDAIGVINQAEITPTINVPYPIGFYWLLAIAGILIKRGCRHN